MPTKKLRYYLTGHNGKDLLMTRGLSAEIMRGEIRKYFNEISSFKTERVAGAEVPEEFHLLAKFLASQFFTIGVIQKADGEIVARWVTTSREKKRIVLTA